MNIFTEYGIKAQIPEAHDLVFTENIGGTEGGGKNIWNSTDMWTQLMEADPTGIKYVTFDGKDCISAYKPNATARAIKFNYGFKENTRYRIRLSTYHDGSAGAGAYFVIWYTDGTNTHWLFGQQNTNKALLNQWYYPTNALNNYISDANKTIDHLAFIFAYEVTTYFDLDSFLITEGTEEIPYEPYQGLTVSYGTSKRVNFKIPSIHNGLTITRIKADGFNGKNRLTYLYIPESVLVLEDRALNSNINITDVYINRPVTLGITTCGTNMFYNCPKLLNIYVPADSITAYKTADNWSYYSDKIRAL